MSKYAKMYHIVRTHKHKFVFMDENGEELNQDEARSIFNAMKKQFGEPTYIYFGTLKIYQEQMVSEKDNFIKIVVSKNPIRRAKELGLELIHYFECEHSLAFKLEKEFITIFSPWFVENETFYVNSKSIDEFIEVLKEVDNSFSFSRFISSARLRNETVDNEMLAKAKEVVMEVRLEYLS